MYCEPPRARGESILQQVRGTGRAKDSGHSLNQSRAIYTMAFWGRALPPRHAHRLSETESEASPGPTEHTQSHIYTQTVQEWRSPGFHRHWSLRVVEPEAGVVKERLGSDSQVTWPLNLRMYLYSMRELAGSVTVTEGNSVGQPGRTWRRQTGARTAPGGVVRGREDQRIVRRPVLERIDRAGDVDVLCVSS